jgi:hypothetical protein
MKNAAMRLPSGLVVDSFASVLRLDFHMIITAITAFVFAAPIAGLVSPVWRWVSVVYAAVWMVTLAPSTAVYLWLMRDAWRIFRHREPILVPRMILVAIAAAQNNQKFRHSWRMQAFAWFSLFANPIANLAIATLAVAIGRRTEPIAEVLFGQQPQVRPRPEPPSVEFKDPAVRYGVPVIETVPPLREFAHAG